MSLVIVFSEKLGFSVAGWVIALAGLRTPWEHRQFPHTISREGLKAFFWDCNFIFLWCIDVCTDSFFNIGDCLLPNSCPSWCNQGDWENSQGLYLVFLFSRFGIACFNELITGRTIAARVIIIEIVAGLMIRLIDLNAKPIRSPLIIWLKIIAVIAALINRSIAIVCESGSLSLSFFWSPCLLH